MKRLWITLNIHSGEWQIKEINYQHYDSRNLKKIDRRVLGGEITKTKILYHQSSKLKYDQIGSVSFENSWDPRREYFESCFLPEKWVQVERK